jgi:hypothetical protein
MLSPPHGFSSNTVIAHLSVGRSDASPIGFTCALVYLNLHLNLFFCNLFFSMRIDNGAILVYIL